MPITYAQVTSISNDTGSNGNDFLTKDTTLSLQGVAAGTGTMGIWITGGAFGPGILIGSQTFSGGPGIWSFDFTSFQLPEGDYTIVLTKGTNNMSTVVGNHSLSIDTTAPDVQINSIEGDDVLTFAEASDGVTISGTTDADDGETVRIKIFDDNNTLVETLTATVSGGNWSANLTHNQAEALSAGDYTVRAAITDDAGNNAHSEHVFESVVCFMPGTRIACPGGDVEVEKLSAGDLVTTVDGRSAPVLWVGRQTVSTIFADRNRILPVQIKAGALSENVPSRDLLVSPDHAIMLDGVLVQAAALVNGTSIVREANVPQIFTYYHVELADHSLILAENVAAETFIDNVGRMAFDNWHEHEMLHAEGQKSAEMSYPRAKSARQVPSATRERLARRADDAFAGATSSAA